MALFDFKLRPLTEVKPWGGPDSPSLSWFGLTDGHYCIRVGAHTLFEYSAEFIARVRAEEPDRPIAEWVDYYVVRPYEDLFEILPAALTPVPEPLWRQIETCSDQRAWLARLSAWCQAIDDEDPELDGKHDLLDAAWGWFRNRRLDGMYLQGSPTAYFFRFQDEIIIRWDNSRCVRDGVYWWSAVEGEMRMSVSDFQSEVQSFHDRLMQAMEVRIELLKNENPLPHVKIDLEALEREHQARTMTPFGLAEARFGDHPFDQVISANTQILGSI